MPPKFSADYSKLISSQGEPLSAATIAIYKAALNKIAKTGYGTRDDLLKHPKDIIKIIGDEFSTNAKRRVALSAVFRVLGDVPNEKRVLYYDYFQKCKDPVEK
jgi:hypothetical protein